MFDSCYELADYAGTASENCWQYNYSRRPDVYFDFISCVNAAELADPCDETADLVVSQCAADSDARACVEPVDSCAELALECEAFDVADCDAAMAPLATSNRDAIIGCMSTFIIDLGPNYEGCEIDFTYCLDPAIE
jgi:hypothetical protein